MNTYIYGTCTPPPDEGGCSTPLSMSSSPSCERPHSLVRRYRSGGALRHRHIRVRGVPAALYDEGPRARKIEIFTGAAVVSIFADSDDLARSAARSVVAAPTSTGGARTPNGRLAPPVEGAAEDDARRNPRC